LLLQAPGTFAHLCCTFAAPCTFAACTFAACPAVSSSTSLLLQAPGTFAAWHLCCFGFYKRLAPLLLCRLCPVLSVGKASGSGLVDFPGSGLVKFCPVLSVGKASLSQVFPHLFRRVRISKARRLTLFQCDLIQLVDRPLTTLVFGLN
jgi:hypothetical protein